MNILKKVNGVLGKVCSMCETWKPLDDYYKQKEGLGGRKAGCKECKGKQTKQWREKNPQYHTKYSKEWYQNNKPSEVRTRVRRELEERNNVIGKECSVCCSWKPLDDFYNHKKGLGGKNEKCKQCFLQHLRNRSSYNENKEYYRAYYKKNFLKYKHLYRLHYHKRRARKAMLVDDFTSTQETEVFSYFDGCALTGEKEGIHWDHVIPLSLGQAGTTIGNMVPLKDELNISKKNSNIFEWFIQSKDRFNLNQERFDKLIEWLAKKNKMSIEDYKEYVYWCHINPRGIN